MSANCKRCSRKSPDAFLCSTCKDDLRELLTGMARGNRLRSGRWSRPWLVSLEDAALGQTRLGESQRKSSDRNSPLPFSESASALLTNVNGMLTTWVRHLCETRGAPIPALDTTRQTIKR